MRKDATEPRFLRKLIGHWKSVLTLIPLSNNIIVSIDSGGAVNVWCVNELINYVLHSFSLIILCITADMSATGTEILLHQRKD